MKFFWSDEKGAAKRKKYKIGFEVIEAIFYGQWALTESPNYPGQYRATGFAKDGRLFTVACRDWEDDEGTEVIELITFWKASKDEKEAYNEIFK